MNACLAQIKYPELRALLYTLDVKKICEISFEKDMPMYINIEFHDRCDTFMVIEDEDRYRMAEFSSVMQSYDDSDDSDEDDDVDGEVDWFFRKLQILVPIAGWAHILDCDLDYEEAVIIKQHTGGDSETTYYIYRPNGLEYPSDTVLSIDW